MAGFFSKIADMFRDPDDDFDDGFDDDFGYDDDDTTDEETSRPRRSQKTSDSASEKQPILRQKSARKIVPYRTEGKSKMEVVVIKPNDVNDAKVITETLLAGRAVVVNLEGQRFEVAQRIMDFAFGSVYAINGSLQNINNYIFLVVPPNIEISGDVGEIATNSDIDISSLGNGATVRF